MKHIVRLTGNPTIDKSTRTDHVMPERKLRCEPPRREPGAGGINASRAVHRLGGRSTAFYLAGGPTGGILGKPLDDEGVEHRVPPIAGCTRESLQVLVEHSGQQFRFGMPGSEVSDADRIFGRMEGRGS